MNNNWYVITGGPSTGKTTLLTQLEMLGYLVVPEAARSVIDESLGNGISIEELRRDEKKFQEDVLQRKSDIESTLNPKKTTFFDRGMHDTTAYLKAYDYTIEPWAKKLIQSATYKKVFLLEPLGKFEKDYARTEDAAFTNQLHDLLIDAYSEYGIEVVTVPALNVESRTNFILHQVKQEGAPL